MALPPLRERREDIPVLMEHFLARYFRRRDEDVPPVSDAVRRAFLAYDWPGNVRELENACERIAQTCMCGTVRAGCLTPAMLMNSVAVPEPAAAVAESGGTSPVSLDDRLREVETSLIAWALKVSAGNKSRAAELLKVKRSTLGDRIVRCGLEAPAAEPVAALAG
jgi:DNA-binding NtrC family response regulator